MGSTASNNILSEIAKQLNEVTQGLGGDKTQGKEATGLISSISMFLKTIEGFKKINMDNLDESRKNMVRVSSYVRGFTSTLANMMDVLDDELKKLNSFDTNKIIKSLMSVDRTAGPEGLVEKGDGSKYLTYKDPGVIDVMMGILGICDALTKIDPPNPHRFRRKFKRLLNMFMWAYDRMVVMSVGIDKKSIKRMSDTSTALKDIMQELPLSVELMVDMFAKVGNPRKWAASRIGSVVLFGNGWRKQSQDAYRSDSKNKPGGVFSSFILMGAIFSYMPKEKVFEDFNKSAKAASAGISLLMLMFSSVVVMAPLATVGVLLLFGRGKNDRSGGLMGIIIKGFTGISNRKDAITESAGVLMSIGITVGVLSLALLALVAAGRIILVSWDSILAVSAFVVVVIGMFWAIGRSAQEIHKGGQELFYIAATVGILSIVVLAMVLAGNLLKAEWDSIGAVSLFMVVLIGAFMLVGLSTKWIDKGGKELFYIAATVGILALIATGMVFIGQFLHANWDGIMAISVFMVVLAGVFIALAFASGWIDDGAKSMITMSIGIVIMAGIIFALYVLANITEGKRGDMWGVFAMMVAVVGVFILISALLGASKTIMTVGVILMGVVILLAYAMVGFLMFVLSVVDKVMDLGTRLGNPDNISKAIAGKLAAPLMAFFEPVGPKGETIIGLIGSLAGVSASSVLKMIGIRSIVRSISGIASDMKDIASLNIPVAWDDTGKPIRFRPMNRDDFKNAALNASAILLFWTSLFGEKATSIRTGWGGFNIIPLSMKAVHVSIGARLKTKRLMKIVGYIGRMAETLQHMASLNIPMEFDDTGKPIRFRPMNGEDFKNAALNASAILLFWTSLFNEKTSTITTGWGSFNIVPLNMKDVNASISARMKIKRLMKIVGYVGDMATTLQNVAALAIPSEIDESTGKPTKWRQMTSADFELASQNVATIATTIVGAIADEGLATALDDMSRKAAKNFERIMTPMGSITGIVETIQLMAGGEYVKTWKTAADGQRVPDEYGSFIKLLEDKESIKNNIASMLTVVVGAVAQLEDMDIIDDASDAIEDLSKVTTGAIPIIQSLMDVYSNTGIKDIDPQAYKNKMGSPLEIMRDLVSDVAGASMKATPANLDKIRQNIDSVSGLMKQIDNTNLDKLKSASSMMDHIATLSKSIRGNFKELAKIINEDLLEAIDLLNENLEKLGDMGINVPAPTVTTISDMVPAKNGERNKQAQEGPNMEIRELVKKIDILTTQITSITGRAYNPVNNSWKVEHVNS